MGNIAAAQTKMADVLEFERSEPSTAEGEVLRLFQTHGPALLRFCQSVMKNPGDAEDVLQETFLKLLRHLRAEGSRSNLKAWLFTVAANGCRSRLRGRFRWKPWSAESDDRIVPARDEPQDTGMAMAALRALRPRDRLLLSLRAQGLTYREIAAAADIREPSVGRLLARAVDRWKQMITRRGGHDGLSE